MTRIVMQTRLTVLAAIVALLLIACGDADSVGYSRLRPAPSTEPTAVATAEQTDDAGGTPDAMPSASPPPPATTPTPEPTPEPVQPPAPAPLQQDAGAPDVAVPPTVPLDCDQGAYYLRVYTAVNDHCVARLEVGLPDTGYGPPHTITCTPFRTVQFDTFEATFKAFYSVGKYAQDGCNWTVTY